jgi:hypothetical protein
MKPLVILILAFAFPALADNKTDDECEAAVDAAESMNVNRKDCDYSDKGLNGFLQKAFKKGEEGASLNTGEVPAQQPIQAGQPLNTQSANVQKNTDKNFLFRVEVDQWANLPAARTQLLPKALEKCGKGFSIIGEHYRGLPMGRIELALTFQCD